MKKYTTAVDYQRSLSSTSAAMVNDICNKKLASESIDLASSNLDPILKSYPYTLNGTPVILSRENTEKLANASVSFPMLVRKMIKIIFNDDVKKIANFYGVDDKYLSDTLSMDILPHTICRNDIIHSKDGYKIIELNVSGNLGGWQTHLYESLYRTNKNLKQFIGSTDTIKLTNILQHYVNCLVNSSQGGEEKVGLLVVIDDPAWHDRVVSLYKVIFSRLKNSQHASFIFVSAQDDISFSDHKMYVGGQRVHAVLRRGDSKILTNSHSQLLDCFVNNNLVLPDNPLSVLLSDKRSLALLYSIKDDSAFTQHERELVDKYLPWTVLSGLEKITYGGKEIALGDFMRSHKDELVVKLADGYQGYSVHVGRYSNDQKWQELSNELLTNNKYVIQQFYPSNALLAENGDQGYTLFDCIWGVFSFAGTYGGMNLRIMPQGNFGIINAAQGAQVALVFEQHG